MTVAARLRAWLSRAWLAALAVALVLAVLVLVHIDKVIGPHGITAAGDADVYYHLRRILLATARWPRVPDFDAWMSYPDGAYGAWPPLFDALPAGFAALTGADPLRTAVLWPAVLGALCALPLLAIGTRLYGRAAGAGAVALLAIMPAHVAIASVGRTDHHVAEILLQLWLYAWLLRDLSALERGEPLRLRAAAGYGALMGAALLTWSGALLFLCLPPAIVALWSLPPRSAVAADRGARHIAIAGAVAACTAAPYGLLNATYGRAAFGFAHVSLLQPLLCVALGAAVLGLRWLTGPLLACDAPRAVRRALLLIVLALVPWLLPAMRAQLLAGLAYVSGGGASAEFLAQVSEARPLLATAFTREFARQHVGYGYLLLAPAALLLALRVLRVSGRTTARLSLLVWCAQVALLTAMQSRFLYYASPLLALLPFVACDELRGRARAVRLAAPLLVVAALAPGYAYYWGPLFQHGTRAVPLAQIDDEQLAFLTGIQRVTPPAGDPGDPDRRPAYGVFAPWELGHPLLVLAERPVVANNFGPYMAGGSYADQERMYRAIANEPEALALLERRRCNYLLTRAGASPPPPTFVARLHAGDGSDGATGAGSGRLRLVHASARGSYKLFERVPGALLDFGGAVLAPRLRVEHESAVAGRTLRYARAVTRESPQATAQVRVSYAGEYRIASEQTELGRITVSEQAIRAGRTLQLARR
jgi:dolichyl-phosphooligosaccharide-protein glycotransferase